MQDLGCTPGEAKLHQLEMSQCILGLSTCGGEHCHGKELRVCQNELDALFQRICRNSITARCFNRTSIDGDAILPLDVAISQRMKESFETMYILPAQKAVLFKTASYMFETCPGYSFTKFKYIFYTPQIVKIIYLYFILFV